MDFDIRDYLWNIFEISKYQKINSVNLASEMFFENLELGYERYKGATNIDYEAVSKLWISKPESFKKHEKNIFINTIKKSYTNLCIGWKNNDREFFNRACWVGLEMFGVKKLQNK